MRPAEVIVAHHNFKGDYTDASVERFAEFYYGCAIELGWPSNNDPAPIRDVSKYADDDSPLPYPPSGIAKSYSSASVDDLSAWLKSDASGVLLVYGENDPYTAAQVDIVGAKDALKLVAPGANHATAKLATLSDADRVEGLKRLQAWTGLMPATKVMSLRAPAARMDEERERHPGR